MELERLQSNKNYKVLCLQAHKYKYFFIKLLVCTCLVKLRLLMLLSWSTYYLVLYIEDNRKWIHTWQHIRLQATLKNTSLLGHSRPLFLYFLSFLDCNWHNYVWRFYCRCQDSNCRSLVSEATAMPTAPQPRPNFKNTFIHKLVTHS